MAKVSEIEEKKVKIDKAYLVSCVNSRYEDLIEAAEVLKGKTIAEHVKFYVAAASSEIKEKAVKSGHWQILLDAGAIELPPSCGPCIGLGTGLLEDGEIGIAATNRNFKGRMGSPSAFAYLASPAIVAYSALNGYISGNINTKKIDISADFTESKAPELKIDKVKIIEGFPEIMEGDLLFCYQDNLNTDGIYAGKYTYNDDFTPTQQAEAS